VEAAFTWAERVRARAFADLLGEGRLEDVATAADVQAALPANTVVLVYFTTGVLDWDMPMLKHIPPGNPLREILLLPPQTFLFTLTQEHIAAHDCAIDPNHFSGASPRGLYHERFMHQQVLPRLRDTLISVSSEAAADRLVVIPHGPLHHVPFSALVRDSSLSYAPSATVLSRRKAAELPANAPGLAVGYNGRRDNRLLRYTEAEVRAVARLIGGDAWTGPEAKKERLRQAAASQRRLHISCHGWFNEADPLSSYLETGRDEWLTAREVLEEWRLSAQLVTLSACQTGVSHLLRGDEPMGLIRAFLHVGARAVLVSQWPVEDLPAYLLMTRFYQLLGNESDYALALIRAQEWLRDLTAPQVSAWLAGRPADEQVETDGYPEVLPAGDHPFAHPRYWAAFVLYVTVLKGEANH
jgi:CHAT domain-containing protein